MPAAVPVSDPASALQFISAAVSVAKFLVSERLAVTVSTIRDYFSGQRRPVPQALDTADGVALVSLLVIDPELLEDLTEQAEEGIEKYRACLRSASSPQERAACDRRAERDVCDTLNRIRDRNNDKLPGAFLDGQWQSFRCVRV